MTYKIVFDSNFLWKDDRKHLDRIFNSRLIELKKFINDNKIEEEIQFCIPELVFKERLAQTLLDINQITQKIETSFEELGSFGIKKPNSKYKNNKYEEYLTKGAFQFMKENGINLLKIPKIKQEYLVERAVKYQKPFNRPDRGFKDTIIWLTLLEDAKKTKDATYVFCTKDDSAFNDESFKTEMGLHKNKFYTATDTENIKVFFDNELKLNLKLREKYAQIENEIMNKVGSLIVEINRSYKPRKNHFAAYSDNDTSIAVSSINTALPLSGYYVSDGFSLTNKDREIGGYDFKKIRIKDIREVESDLFEVDTELSLIEKISRDNQSNSYMSVFRSQQDNIVVSEVKVRYNFSSKELSIVDVQTPRHQIAWNYV